MEIYHLKICLTFAHSPSILSTKNDCFNHHHTTMIVPALNYSIAFITTLLSLPSISFEAKISIFSNAFGEEVVEPPEISQFLINIYIQRRITALVRLISSLQAPTRTKK